jgi:hypothetical protein
MTKKFHVFIGLVTAGILFYNFMGNMASQKSGKEFLYIGSKKCSMCHKTAKQGEQYKIWSESKHASAYSNLASEAGKQKAKKLGVPDPQKSEKCLSCHTTAPGNKDLWDKGSITYEGVGCETCHGPGSVYKKISIMKNRELALKSGMILGDKNTCLSCHKKDNPEHSGVFNYEEAWESIKHPIPKGK